MQIRKLTKELQRKAEEELNEVPARMQEDVQHIREWLHSQPHLCFPDDDQIIVLFLRLCKYRLQKTKERIDNICRTVVLLPELFNDRDPFSPEIQTILKANIFAVLPNTEDTTGPRVLMIRLNKCNPETMSAINLSKVCNMILQMLVVEDDVCTIGGLTSIVDFKGFNSGYMLQMNLSFAVRLITVFQKGNAARVRNITYINVPSGVETFFNAIKHMLSDKLKKRVNVYSKGNAGDFYKAIPQSTLPKEYGGNGDSFDEMAAVWKQKIESYRSEFVDRLYYSNEELRPEQSKASLDLGVEGSFRKLDID